MSRIRSKVCYKLTDILGPLARTVNGKTTILGIVSWGRRSCDMHSVYSRVSHPRALKWIHEMLKTDD